MSLSYQFIKAILIFLSVPEEHYHNPLIPPLPGVPVMRRWAHGLAEWGQPSRRAYTAAEGQKDGHSLAPGLGQLPAHLGSVPCVTSMGECVIRGALATRVMSMTEMCVASWASSSQTKKTQNMPQAAYPCGLMDLRNSPLCWLNTGH